MERMLVITFVYLACVVFCKHNWESADDDVEERLFRTIAVIKDNNIKEQLEIEENETWEERAGATMIAVVMNAAYTLALRAVKKSYNHSQDRIQELDSLNQVFAAIDSKFQNRNLTVSVTDAQMKIGFASKEAFENGTASNTPLSIRYLPVMTVLYNANHRNAKVIEVFKKACQEFNPIRVVKNKVSHLSLSSKEYSSLNTTAENLIALHKNFIIDQMDIYAQSLAFTECIALSQKHKLTSEEPLVISQALPQFSIPLNLLRKKYYRVAQMISGHTEL